MISKSFLAAWLTVWVAIEDGANPKEVMVEMGHSNIAMTYDLYGHLFTDEDADTRRAERAERLTRELGGGLG